MAERPIPPVLWFGTVSGQWPIQCFESETHAMTWYGQPADNGHTKHLWKATVGMPVEYEVITPEPVLQPKTVPHG